MLCNEMTSLSLAPAQPQQVQQQPQQTQQQQPQQQAQHIVSGPVLPRTSTEAMYSTEVAGPGTASVGSTADEGMDDEVCFLMDHVEVSRCDPAAPNPHGPILPYIL